MDVEVFEGNDYAAIHERIDALVHGVEMEVPDNIREIFVKYFYIYVFMVYGHVVGNKNDLQFHLLSIAKLNFDLQLPTRRFFTNELTFLIFDYFDILQQTKYILSLDDAVRNRELEENYRKYERTVQFLNEVGMETIGEMFVGEAAHHNIIMFIIIKLIYERYDKPDIVKINNDAQLQQLEFRYIYIRSSNSVEVSVQDIWLLLGEDDNGDGRAEDYYGLLFEEDARRHLFSSDYRIVELFRKKLLYPITDDFLRYHLMQEIKVDTAATRIANVVEPMNAVKYYEGDRPNDNLFFPPLLHRRAVAFNEFEEMSLVSKYRNMDRTKFIDPLYYDLFQYRQYAYHSYQRPTRHGFSYVAPSTATALRYSNFEFIDKHQQSTPDYRAISNTANVVGVAVVPYPAYLQYVPMNYFLDSATLHDNAYIGLLRYIASSFKSKHLTPLYYLYDPHNTFKLSVTAKNTNHFKSLLNQAYELYERLTFELVRASLLPNTHPYYNTEFLRHYRHELILENPALLHQLEHAIYFELREHRPVTDDEQERRRYGYDDAIPLPSYDPASVKKTKIITLRQEEAIEYMPLNAVCYHHSVYNAVFRLRNAPQFNELLNNFVDTYVLYTGSAALCRSCGEVLALERYITSEYEDIVVRTTIEIPLFEIREYAKYEKSIKSMDVLFEKLSMIVGYATFVGSASMQKRHNAIKGVIDLLNHQYARLKKETSAERQKLLQKFQSLYHTAPDNTQLYLFAMDNEIFTFSRKDIDKFKLIKYNNVVCYFVLFVLMQLNKNQIAYLTFDKIFNYKVFDLKFRPLFRDIRIYTSSATLSPLEHYPVLCYLLFFFAALIVKNKKYYAFHTATQKIDIIAIKNIIHTTITIMNALVYKENEDADVIDVKNFKVRYFHQLELFRDQSVLDNLQRVLDQQMHVVDNKIVYRASDIVLFSDTSSALENEVADYDLVPHMRVRYPLKLNYYRVPHAPHRPLSIPALSPLNICLRNDHVSMHHALNKKFDCSKCGKNINKLRDEKSSEEVAAFVVEEDIALKRQLYCADGSLHAFMNGECMKCKYVKGTRGEIVNSEEFLLNILARKAVREPTTTTPPAAPSIAPLLEDFQNSVLEQQLQSLVTSLVGYFDASFKFHDLYTETEFFIHRSTVSVQFTHDFNILKEPLHFPLESLQYIQRDLGGALQTFLALEHQNNILLFHPLTLYYVGYYTKYNATIVSQTTNYYLTFHPSFLLRFLLGGYSHLFIRKDELRQVVMQRYLYMQNVLQSLNVAISRVRHGTSFDNIPYFDILNPVFKKTAVRFERFTELVRGKYYTEAAFDDIDVYRINGADHVRVFDLVNVKSADNFVIHYMLEQLQRMVALVAAEHNKYVTSNFIMFLIFHINSYYVFNTRQLNERDTTSTIATTDADTTNWDEEEIDADAAMDARESLQALDISRDADPDDDPEADPDEDYRTGEENEE